jgi:hypothetical protein
MLRSPVYGPNILIVNKNIPHLLTYPRSGSHYFEDMLYEQKQINFTKSHFLTGLFDNNNNKNRPIVTIARDPIDSISSYVARFYFGYPGQEYLVPEKITEYVLMYSFLYEHADYVIDFNDLIRDPESIINKLLSLLDIGEDKYHFFNRDLMTKYEGFLPSSKSLPEYSKDRITSHDTSLCYFYYNRLLEKKITI